MFRDPLEVVERLLVSNYSAFACERLVLKVEILLAAVAKQHHHEVHRVHGAVTAAQFLAAEVHLCICPGRSLRKCLISTFGRSHLRKIVLAAKLHYIVVDGLRRYIRKVGIVLFQPIVHLGRRGVLIKTKTMNNEVLVGLKNERLPGDALRECLEFRTIHVKIFLHCTEV